eukprot:Gb_23539 [translate_table: standard]
METVGAAHKERQQFGEAILRDCRPPSANRIYACQSGVGGDPEVGNPPYGLIDPREVRGVCFVQCREAQAGNVCCVQCELANSGNANLQATKISERSIKMLECLGVPNQGCLPWL